MPTALTPGLRFDSCHAAAPPFGSGHRVIGCNRATPTAVPAPLRVLVTKLVRTIVVV